MTLAFDRTTRRTTKLGYFGERLLDHWLCRAGFHTADADAEGIDVLATRPIDEMRIAVSVKARFYSKLDRGGIATVASMSKMRTSSALWNSTPWLAIYAESLDRAVLVAIPLDHFQAANYSIPSGRWLMIDLNDASIEKLQQDPKVHCVSFSFAGSWFPNHVAPVAFSAPNCAAEA